jgi:hypothetical protein
VQPATTIEQFKQHTARKLIKVRCPDHQQPPRLKFSGQTMRDVSIQMSGCCAKLIDLANRAITGR